MFSNQSLDKYILSADYHKADSAEKLLPLYKYGFVMKEEHFRDLIIDNGYQNTIRRYMENRNSITKQELLCILKHYNIDGIPDLPETFAPNQIKLAFVPRPTISMSGVIPTIEITYVPEPGVSINIATIAIEIEYVPEPQIVVFVPTGITFVPKPTVDFVVPNVSLTYVPNAQVELDQSTVIPNAPSLTFIPHPIVGVGDALSSVIEFVPAPQVTVVPSTNIGDVIYWGVITGYADNLTGRQQLINAFSFNMAGLLNFALPGPVGNLVSVDFPGGFGFAVLAIPMTAETRRSYQDPGAFGNWAPIGGSPSPWITWPDPVLNVPNNLLSGRLYQLYITSLHIDPPAGLWNFSTNLI